MRRGDEAERSLDPHFDRVLLRHGYYWSELERPGVPPLEAGDQLCLGVTSEKLLVE